MRDSPTARSTSAARRLSRREFFGSTLMASLAGACASRGTVATTPAGASRAVAAETLASDETIYGRLLGVQPHLPAFDHITALGGSRMPDEVIAAMTEANRHFVDMHELTIAAGKRIADVMHAEAALVSAGSFSAMLLGAAACLTGTDEEKMAALPHPTWPRRECVIQSPHRVNYDRAFRAAGMTIVEVETREQFASAVSAERTAMIFALARNEYQRADDPSVMTPAEILEAGQRAGVPAMIDAASEIPPTANLTRWTEMGFDLVVISGGKGIRGPQSTGMLAGRADLIEAARLQATPNAHIGRGMKVGKEEIVGLITALNRYVALDHEAEHATWARKARYVAAELAGIPGLIARATLNAKGYEDVELSWDDSIFPMTVQELRARLKDGTPRIAMAGSRIATRCMANDEERLVAARLREFFLEEAARPAAGA